MKVFESIALITTLKAAIGVVKRRRERLEGNDPTEEEPPARATGRLHDWCEILEDLALGIRIDTALAHADEAPEAQHIREFTVLMSVDQAADGLDAAHRSLLSLYPRTSVEMIEEVRCLSRRGRSISEGRGEAVLGEAAEFAVALARMTSRVRLSADI